MRKISAPNQAYHALICKLLQSANLKHAHAGEPTIEHTPARASLLATKVWCDAPTGWDSRPQKFQLQLSTLNTKQFNGLYLRAESVLA